MHWLLSTPTDPIGFVRTWYFGILANYEMSVFQIYLIHKNYFFRWFLPRLGSTVPQIRLKLFSTWIRSWDTDQHRLQAAQPSPAPPAVTHRSLCVTNTNANGLKFSARVYITIVLTTITNQQVQYIKVEFVLILFLSAVLRWRRWRTAETRNHHHHHYNPAPCPASYLITSD